MRALLVKSANDWAIADLPQPIAGEGEVVLSIVASGICGTDLHTLSGSNTAVKFPITPGHEFGGVVASVGNRSSIFKIGDRVVVNPSRTCENCKFCLNGRSNLCPSKGGYGTKYPGGFSNFVAVQEKSCVLIPESMSWKTALLAEPLACVLTGLTKLQDVAGKDVLIIGGGPIGALFAYALKNFTSQITVVEPVEERRTLISHLGIKLVMDPQDIPADHKWDVVIDATGNAHVMQDSLRLVESGGIFLIMGVAKPDDQILISPQMVNRWEFSIVGSFSINNTFEDAVELLSAAGDNLEILVTDIFELEVFEEALKAMRKKSAMKILVKCSEESLL